MSKDDPGFLWGGELIHKESDEWGNILVIDRGRQRMLTFDSIYEQSCQDKQQPNALVHSYLRGMILGLAFITRDPKKITVLGLGGGCLVRSLDSTLNNVAIDAVELRSSVVEVAKKYFGLPEGRHINIHVLEAEKFIASQLSESTDCIFLDIYHADGICDSQLQATFLQDCCRILRPEGWVIINFHNMPDINSPYFISLVGMFAEVFICKASDMNYILYAGKNIMEEPISYYARHAETLIPIKNIRFDLLFKRIIRFSRG